MNTPINYTEQLLLNELTAISPIDGRYRNSVTAVANYFSEYALIKHRIYVEVEYFIFLANKKFFKLSAATKKNVEQLVVNFTVEQAQEIKQIEATTKHDVKAVEIFLRNYLDQINCSNLKEWVHFGLTSQDINNTAIQCSLQQFFAVEYLPAVNKLVALLNGFAKKHKSITILARTHGQPASPTNLGKEIMVFVERLQQQIALLQQVPFTTKFGGATGNFNAHNIAFTQKKWITLGNEFVEKHLHLQRQQYTTQIEHYDNLAALCHATERIHTILIDFCRDMWSYISINYFTQKTVADEVGSSAMPHKVNPINFENAEGNLGIANALLQHFAAKLPISRWQRDLTDSTVLRNLGIPFAHSILSIQNITTGLQKLQVNTTVINNDLENNWSVVTEAIQTILRRENYDNAYNELKNFSRGNSNVTQQTLHQFIDSLNIKAAIKTELKKITPHNYCGVFKPF